MSLTSLNPSAAPRLENTTLLPGGWPKPKGYANGIVAEGRMVFLAGQIGWNEAGVFAEGFTGQVRQALNNIVAILAEANATPDTIVRLTWYVTDIEIYTASLKEIGAIYRETIGPHYPAMTMVQVVRLVEKEAQVEIEATAVLPR